MPMLALQAVGQARVLGELRPAVAAVGGLEEPGARAAAREAPGIPAQLPSSDAYITSGFAGSMTRSMAPVSSSRKRIFCQRACRRRGSGRRRGPALGPAGVAQGRHVDQVGVGGVDPDAGDLAGRLEAEVRPGLAAVGGPVDAVADGRVAADARLAHADVDDVRSPTGATAMAPTDPVLKKPSETLAQFSPPSVGLPHAAAGRALVEGEVVVRITGHGQRPGRPGRDPPSARSPGPGRRGRRTGLPGPRARVRGAPKRRAGFDHAWDTDSATRDRRDLPPRIRHGGGRRGRWQGDPLRRRAPAPALAGEATSVLL